MGATDRPPPAAKVFLHRGAAIYLQLRDDRPDIAYPGRWGLFGGSIEQGEDAEQGLRRELREELGWEPGRVTRLPIWHGPLRTVIPFVAALDVAPELLTCTEGQGAQLHPVGAIARLWVEPVIEARLEEAVAAAGCPQLMEAWRRRHA